MQAGPRIAPVSEPLSRDLAQRMAQLVSAGVQAPQIFLTVARNSGLFTFLVDSGWLGPTGLLDRQTFARPLRECIILRTCVATRNDYEFNLHVQTLARRMGLTAAQIDDVRAAQPSDAVWPADYIAAMRLVDGLAKNIEVSDATLAGARAHFDDAALIEMTQLVGLYVGVAMHVALARPEFDRYLPGPPVLTRGDAPA
jgi:4-carboxymuconolactone decarboxylase